MNKDEILNKVGLVESFIPFGMKNRKGVPIIPTTITIHNTGNPNKGADAQAHARFVTTKGFNTYRGNKSWVSWHFTVDDKNTIKHLPLNEFALHAGPKANTSSIAIENCMNEGIDFALSRERLITLVASLMHDMHFSIGQIRSHRDWTGKDCPTLILEEWQDFIDDVEQVYLDINSTDKLLISVDELGFEPLESERELDDDDLSNEIDHELMLDSMSEFISD